jgi:hypothetical protein
MKKGFQEGKHNLTEPKFSAYLLKVQSSSCKYETDKSLAAAELSLHCLYTLPIFDDVPHLPTDMSTENTQFAGNILNGADSLYLRKFPLG